MIAGFVLRGGGALGAFELGVIEWLLDDRIVPDVVSGFDHAGRAKAYVVDDASALADGSVPAAAVGALAPSGSSIAGFAFR